MGIVKCSLSFWAMRGNYVGNYYNSNNNKLGNNNVLSAAIKLRRQRQGRRQREGQAEEGGGRRVYAVFRTVVRDTDKSKGSPATCPASQRQIYPLAWPNPLTSFMSSWMPLATAITTTYGRHCFKIKSRNGFAALKGSQTESSCCCCCCCSLSLISALSLRLRFYENKLCFMLDYYRRLIGFSEAL